MIRPIAPARRQTSAVRPTLAGLVALALGQTIAGLECDAAEAERSPVSVGRKPRPPPMA